MSAIISECGNYRYKLTRGDQSNPLVFLMLNPSTADANVDDPTIRRCIRFANDSGYSGICVVNLYGFRTSNPKHLQYTSDPVGPLNNNYVAASCHFRDVCCAWGANVEIYRVAEVVRLIGFKAKNLYCLGVTKSGMPRHPLYVKANQKLVPYGAHDHGNR